MLSGILKLYTESYCLQSLNVESILVKQSRINYDGQIQYDDLRWIQVQLRTT